MICCAVADLGRLCPTTSRRRRSARRSSCARLGKATRPRARNSSPTSTVVSRSRCPGLPPEAAPKHSSTRRQVIVGTSAAAAAAVAAVSIDRAVIAGQSAEVPASDIAAGQLTPNTGSWQRVATSSDVPDGRMHPFDLGSISGFVRRVDGKPQAVSGVCTHQGCRLWFDAPDDRLRCPCHSTSFAPSGEVLTHQLPIAPKPLPTLMVREVNGVIEVFAPPRPDETA